MISHFFSPPPLSVLQFISSPELPNSAGERSIEWAMGGLGWCRDESELNMGEFVSVAERESFLGTGRFGKNPIGTHW